MRSNGVWRARQVRVRPKAATATSRFLPTVCPAKATLPMLHPCAVAPRHTSVAMWVAPARQCTTLITPCAMPPAVFQGADIMKSIRPVHDQRVSEWESEVGLWAYDTRYGLTSRLRRSGMDHDGVTSARSDKYDNVLMAMRADTTRHIASLQTSQAMTGNAISRQERTHCDEYSQRSPLYEEFPNNNIPCSTAAAAATSSSTSAALHTQRRHVSSASASTPEDETMTSHTYCKNDCETQSKGQHAETKLKDKASATSHDKATNNDNEEYASDEMMSVPMPSLPEIIAACKILSLVTASGAVQTDWTPTTLKAVYRELARRYHPDLAEGDVECMEQINVAYERLCSLSAAQRAWVQARLRYGFHDDDEENELSWLRRRSGQGRGCLGRLSGWLGLRRPMDVDDNAAYNCYSSSRQSASPTEKEYVTDLARLMAAGFYATLLSTVVWCSSYAYRYLGTWGSSVVEGAGTCTTTTTASSHNSNSNNTTTNNKGPRFQASTTRVVGLREKCMTESSMVRSCVTSTRRSLAAVVVDVLARYAWLAAVCVNAALLRRVFLGIFLLFVR